MKELEALARRWLTEAQTWSATATSGGQRYAGFTLGSSREPSPSMSAKY
jgi:hypothetical protein